MILERDLSQSASRTGMTTMTSGSLTEPAENNVGSCSRRIINGARNDSMVSIQNEEDNETPIIEISGELMDLKGSYIQRLSNASFVPITDSTSISHGLQKSITTSISEKMDELQNETNERIDQLFKSNAVVVKRFDAKLNNIDKQIKQLTEKRMETKNSLHELRRRFECLEHKINKSN